MKIFRSTLTLAAAAALWLAAPASAQTNAIPRTADGKPDFSGFFDIQYTPNMAMGKEDAIPTRPRQSRLPQPRPKDDPTATAGSPRPPHHAIAYRRSSSKPPIAW